MVKKQKTYKINNKEKMEWKLKIGLNEKQWETHHMGNKEYIQEINRKATKKKWSRDEQPEGMKNKETKEKQMIMVYRRWTRR